MNRNSGRTNRSFSVVELILVVTAIVTALGTVVLMAPIVKGWFGGSSASPGSAVISSPMSVLDALPVKVWTGDHQPAREVIVKPSGKAHHVTDSFGECLLDGGCRGTMIEFYDHFGVLVATAQAPFVGELNVDLTLQIGQ